MADPTHNSDELIEVPASDILAKIKRGEPVEYDHVIINGDLEARNLNLPESLGKNYLGILVPKLVVASSIKIINSIINGYFDFRFCIFKDAFNIKNTEITGYVDFHTAEFHWYTNFEGTIFKSHSEFDYCKFCKTAQFADAQWLHWTAWFSSCHFCEDADFHKCRFIGGASFSRAQFIGDSDFWSRM
jgi:hypothetical protein